MENESIGAIIRSVIEQMPGEFQAEDIATKVVGHQHARALRRVSKEILRDLWIEARMIHTGEVPV